MCAGMALVPATSAAFDGPAFGTISSNANRRTLAIQIRFIVLLVSSQSHLVVRSHYAMQGSYDGSSLLAGVILYPV
jgi:hypothetical protein